MEKGIVIILAFAMLAVPCGSIAAENMNRPISLQENEQGEEIPVIIDVLILRPVGVATCIVGLAASVIALPFSIPSKSTGRVYRALVRDPFNYTFKRPLGKNRIEEVPEQADSPVRVER